MMEVMYETPSNPAIEKVVITKPVVEKKKPAEVVLRTKKSDEEAS